MEKNIYLHIGFGKTGTTSIQDFLFLNREKNETYYYPITGIRGTAHHNLSPPNINDFNEIIKLYTLLIEEINGCSHSKIIISSEVFCFVKPNLINYIKQVFNKYNIKIVFYVRSQVPLIESTYLQWLKTGYNYLGNIDNFFNKHWKSFDFLEKIKPWMEVFSQEAIIVRLYDKRVFGDDVCQDFLKAVEIDDKSLVPLSKPSNQSLIPDFTPIIETMDKSIKDETSRKEIIKMMLELSYLFRRHSEKKIIGPNLRDKIIERFCNSNKIFADLFLSEEYRKYFLNQR